MGRGSLRRCSGEEGQKAHRDVPGMSPPHLASFVEKLFKFYFKTEVRGKCSHLSSVCQSSPNCQVL